MNVEEITIYFCLVCDVFYEKEKEAIKNESNYYS